LFADVFGETGDFSLASVHNFIFNHVPALRRTSARQVNADGRG
jgi:hypothetical protein